MRHSTCRRFAMKARRAREGMRVAQCEQRPCECSKEYSPASGARHFAQEPRKACWNSKREAHPARRVDQRGAQPSTLARSRRHVLESATSSCTPRNGETCSSSTSSGIASSRPPSSPAVASGTGVACEAVRVARGATLPPVRHPNTRPSQPCTPTAQTAVDAMQASFSTLLTSGTQRRRSRACFLPSHAL